MSEDKESMKLIKRLKAEMGRTGINARELAERANVGRSFVYDILSGKSENPTTKKLSAIADVLGVNVLYLLDGQQEPANMTGPDADMVSIPSIRIEASASGSSIVSEENNENKNYFFSRGWIKSFLNSSPSDLRTITITGDSMDPTLCDGDEVIVDLRQKQPSPPGIFMVFDGIGLVAKRLESLPEMGLVRIISDNPKYAQYKRGVAEVNIIGRVVWFARKI